MGIWWFIGFIVLISIIFGVSLQSAFWGIVGVVVALCAAGWAFYTKSGKKFTKWAVIIICVCIGVLLTYQGIVKKTTDEKVYNSDIENCEDINNWRYYDARIYTNYNRDYYYDRDKVNNIFDKCVSDAVNNQKLRNDWWFVEAGAGVLLVWGAIETGRDKKPEETRSTQNAKKRTNPHR